MREKRSNPGACMRGDRIALCGGYNGSQYLATCEQGTRPLAPLPLSLHFRGGWSAVILRNANNNRRKGRDKQKRIKGTRSSYEKLVFSKRVAKRDLPYRLPLGVDEWVRDCPVDEVRVILSATLRCDAVQGLCALETELTNTVCWVRLRHRLLSPDWLYAINTIDGDFGLFYCFHTIV